MRNRSDPEESHGLCGPQVRLGHGRTVSYIRILMFVATVCFLLCAALPTSLAVVPCTQDVCIRLPGPNDPVRIEEDDPDPARSQVVHIIQVTKWPASKKATVEIFLFRLVQGRPEQQPTHGWTQAMSKDGGTEKRYLVALNKVPKDKKKQGFYRLGYALKGSSDLSYTERRLEIKWRAE